MLYFIRGAWTHFDFDLLYLHSVIINDIKYPSVEHYYAIKRMSKKSHTSAIMAINAPIDVRKYYQGKSAKEDFDGTGVLIRAYRCFFDQHKKFRKQLLNTGDKPIRSYIDGTNFWNPGAGDFGKEDITGKIFTKLRKEIRNS